MNRFKNYVWMAAGFAVLVAVISGIAAAPAVAALVKAALVKNVDERGRIPYGVRLLCNSITNSCDQSSAPVPLGKRLVIEHVSAEVDVAAPGEFLQFALFQGDLRATLAPSPRVNSFSHNLYSVNDSVLVYVEAGDSFSIIFTATGNIVSTTAYVSGYLVDLTI